MKFIDQAEIQIIAGKGGDGTISFRREKYIPRGGPNGGDGGFGGSIYLQATNRLNTLIDFQHTKEFKAENGANGAGNQCSGRSGKDLFVMVPVGTEIYNLEQKMVVADLKEDGQKVLLAKGGDGGLGNTRFKSSVNRAPREFTKGALGESFGLRLELKLLADVGLLGLPNAGKSSLIVKVSDSKSKIGNYPFTTIKPTLGVVKVDLGTSFVMADIPGLIKGASEGIGLGLDFLRHLSRSKILLHLVDPTTDEKDNFLNLDDLSEQDNLKIVANKINIINEELKNYSLDLSAKPKWLVLTKIDLLDTKRLDYFRKTLAKKFKQKVFFISAANFTELDVLVKETASHLSLLLNENEGQGKKLGLLEVL